MKTPSLISILCVIGATAALFTSCGSSVNNSGSIYDPGYGPFDKKGNYLEAEADKPAKQKRRAGNTESSIAKTKKVETTVKSSKPKTTVAKTTPVVASKPAPKPYVAPKPKPTVVSTPKPKPKPKPKVVSTPKPKPKPKPKVVSKPKSVYHKVAKGDTLYSLSRKYGTSVSAIQKANKLNGTIIALGSSLKIPK